MSIETLLQEEIQNELGELKRISIGTDEYKATVDGVTKLMDRVIEIKKLNIDKDDKAVTREIETDIKSKQMEEERRDRVIKNCITVAGIIVPTLLVGVPRSILNSKRKEPSLQ